MPTQHGKAEQPSIPAVEKIKYVKSTIALRLQKRPLKGAEKGKTNAWRIGGLLENEGAGGKGEFVGYSCSPKKATELPAGRASLASVSRGR